MGFPTKLQQFFVMFAPIFVPILIWLVWRSRNSWRSKVRSWLAIGFGLPLGLWLIAWLLAGLMAGAGVVHLAMAPAHAGGDLIDPLGFALAGWFQLGIAAMVLAGRARRGTFMAAAVGNAVLIGAWAWSRTWPSVA